MRKSIFTSLCLLMFVSGLAHALPVEVPDFAVEPSGEFTISPVAPGEYLSINLADAPLLTYGVTSEPDGTTDTLMMSWGEGAVPGDYAQAGWELAFGEDPDLTNQQIILSINPPGGWTNFKGAVIANPGDPTKQKPDVFQGISSVSVVGIDNNNNILGGWGFNTDQALLPTLPLVNDPGVGGPPPLPAGLSSLANNWMQTVTINVGPVGAAVVASSVLITGGPAGPLICPNFLIGSSNTGVLPILDWTQVQALQFYENGILQAGVQFIPGQAPGSGLLNYWDHITITPEPVTLVLLSVGGIGAVLLRRRRRA